MRYTIKLFGPSRVAARRQEVNCELTQGFPTCGDLRAALAETEPRLAELLGACRFAVNQNFVLDEHPVRPEDEIALIGFVSGG